MAKAESKPTAKPTVTEFVIRRGNQGVFSHSSEIVAKAKFAALESVESGYSVFERTVVYEPLEEGHPQYDPKNPLKVPTGEESAKHPGEVKERKLQW